MGTVVLLLIGRTREQGIKVAKRPFKKYISLGRVASWQEQTY